MRRKHRNMKFGGPSSERALMDMFALCCGISTAIANDSASESTLASPQATAEHGNVDKALQTPVVKLVSRPPLDALQAAAAATGAGRFRAAVIVDIDADGLPTAIEFEVSSGYATVDAAIVEWTKQARFPSGNPGRGHLPFDFEIDINASTTPQRPPPSIKRRPPFGTIMQAMRSTDMGELKLVVEVEYDANGRVTSARLLERTSNRTVENAVLDWAKKIVVDTDQPGIGRLPFTFEAN